MNQTSSSFVQGVIYELKVVFRAALAYVRFIEYWFIIYPLSGYPQIQREVLTFFHEQAPFPHVVIGLLMILMGVISYKFIYPDPGGWLAWIRGFD